MYEMLDKEQLAVLQRGTAAWNAWRQTHPNATIHLDQTSLRGLDLSGAALQGASFVGTDLSKTRLVGADLRGARLKQATVCWSDLSGANLQGVDALGADLRFSSFVGANLQGAWLWKTRLGASGFLRADLRKARLDECDASVEEYGYTTFKGADLREAVCRGADMSQAVFDGADLRGASLQKVNLAAARFNAALLGGARFDKADLSHAQLASTTAAAASFNGANLSHASLVDMDLSGADLRHAIMVQTDFSRSRLVGCSVYGVAAWDLVMDEAEQADLDLTPPAGGAGITVDNLEVAQFVYLLLYNEKIRHVIDTVTAKAVLILGRFTPERKPVLDALRSALRARNYVPMLFDFDKPASRDLTETVQILAHMARFIVADLTDAKSLPQELMAIVPGLPSVPVQPLILAGEAPYAMFEHFRRYPWVLPKVEYASIETLIATLADTVIRPADELAARLKP